MDNLFSCIAQHAVTHPKTQTPLWNCERVQSADVSIEERPLMGHFNLRMHPRSSDRPAAETLLGLTLPDTPLSSHTTEDVSAHWIAPDDWLVLMPFQAADTFESRFRAVMQGHYSIVDVSGGQTVIRLSGPMAREVLQKSTMIDVHPDQFPVGKVVGTAFAKSSATIVCVGDDIFDLIVRRSFAAYIWDWLVDATVVYR